jgi:chloride channel protein, CIC family
MQDLIAGIKRQYSNLIHNENTFLLLSALAIGIISGLGAVGFRYLIAFFQHIFYGPFDNYLTRLGEVPWYQRLLIPIGVGLLLGPITYFFKEIRGHGVPEVMESVVLKGGRLPPRAFPLKALASSLCIASGGSVGREGPIVMIGATTGSVLGQVFGISARRMRILIACGAAGGIAATFNAPISGIVFAIEIIIGEFYLDHFSPIVMSSVVATAISHWLLGNTTSFIVTKYQLVGFHELINYALLGLCAAFVAVFYTRSLYKTEEIFDRLKVPGYFKPAIGGALLGVVGIFLPQVFGVGYETVDLILNGQIGLWYILALLLLFKVLVTSITLGSGGSGGIFAPSLFIGASMGGMLGYVFNYLMPGATAPIGAYAMVGMGAVVAGAIHGPFTAIMIIFEMTDDYKVILPLMIACILSTVTSTALQKDSIYTMKLSRRGINIFKGRELNVLKSLYVRDVMSRDHVMIREDTDFRDIMNIFIQSKHTSYPVVDTADNLKGFLSLDDIRSLVRDEDNLHNLIIAKDIAVTSVFTALPDQDLSEIMKMFANLDIEEIPVLESKDSRKVVGVITRKDVLDAYNDQMVKRGLV